MRVISRNPKALLLLAMLAGTASASLPAQAQEQVQPENNLSVTVHPNAQAEAEAAPAMAEMSEGPEVEGVITARTGNQVQVTAEDGSNSLVAISDATQIKASGGFLGLGRNQLAEDALLNGLPVSIKTWQSGSGLVARQINLKNKNLKMATMIHNATDQRFSAQGAAIAQNSAAISDQQAATEALRGRMGDLDQYNVKSTTSVNFATGKAVLSAQAKNDLCAAASSAETMDNALLLVVGYTDSTGSQDLNQRLSEKRAGSVVNHLQQVCGWKPYRMLTPTGMAEADPLGSNDTTEGKAQNRRVEVSVLVSKGLDGL